MRLLTREEFKAAVFKRDGGKCIYCKKQAVDAHHLVERRVFPDGGYYLDNGVSLCEADHIRAERMDISPEMLRELAGIKTVVLPPGFTGKIDKWANEVIDDVGHRKPGPLFNDPGFQKICRHMMGFFRCGKCNEPIMVIPNNEYGCATCGKPE